MVGCVIDYEQVAARIVQRGFGVDPSQQTREQLAAALEADAWKNTVRFLPGPDPIRRRYRPRGGRF